MDKIIESVINEFKGKDAKFRDIETRLKTEIKNNNLAITEDEYLDIYAKVIIELKKYI